MTYNRTRDFSLDALKALSIVMVVMIHISATGFVVFGDQWIAAMFFDCISRIAVPVFFMVTGALLLRKRHPLSEIFVRIRIVGIPLLAWSIIYSAVAGDIGQSGAVELFWRVVQGPVLHLWYIYALIGAYLFLPLTSAVYLSLNKKERIYLLVLWFIGASVGPLFQELTGKALTGIDLSYLPIYFGYMLAGAVITDALAGRVEQKVKWISLVVWLVSTAVTIYATYSDSVANNKVVSSYIFYYSPSVLISALAAFTLLKLSCRNNDRGAARSCIAYLGSQTLGVYLCHMIPLQILPDVISRTSGVSPWIWYPLIAFLGVFISLGMVEVIQRIPYVRAICPK
jgi:surface polysaccharide O-acyltransferase-like enzyme